MSASSFGVRVKDASSNITFDTTVETTLFRMDEQTIAGSSVGPGLTFRYPGYAGVKIVAMLTSPYQSGNAGFWAVMSCRVSYPGGVPTVSVFVDNTNPNIQVCDGYLIVFATGASQ